MADKLFASLNSSKSSKSVYVDRDDSLHLDDLDESEPIFEKNDNILREQHVPFVNQLFDTLEEAENFYRAYAVRNGFEIKIKTTRKRSNGHEIAARLYVCRKGGKPYGQSSITINDDEKCEVKKGKRQRDCIGRTECQARMYIVQKKNIHRWEVTSLELQHNHQLVSPSKVSLMQRERNITPVARNIIETLNKSGIGPSGVMNVFTHLGGGLENVGFGSQNVRNVLREQRRNSLEVNDAEAGIQLLRQLNADSGDKYFVRTELDEQKRLKYMLWVDPRSLLAYQNFGDVVAFDTTYRTNRYSMPFVPFTGVNHHFQSIVFGFALMRDESEATFVWVLKTWLEAMDNKYPVTIITDQDLAMSNAIAKVLPNTHHLLCSWHISNKFPEKLSNLYSKHPKVFKEDFNLCVYKSFTPIEFEARWKDLIEKYDLHDHSWLQQMYGVRHKWIRAYTRRVFAAGQTTTSRSEGMNAYFDSYVSSSTGIKEFVENSQKVLEKQYMREKQADYETAHRERKMSVYSALEYHAANIYTKEMFRRFQIELFKANAFVNLEMKDESTEFQKCYDVYKATVPEEKRRHYYLLYNTFEDKVSCICQKFQNDGMPCRHIIRFLNNRNVTQIPEYLITYRWTRDSNRVDGLAPYNTKQPTSFLKDSPTMRFNNLAMATMSFCQSGMCSMDRYNYAMDVIARELPNLERLPVDGIEQAREFPILERLTPVNVECVEKELVLDPVVSQTKGRKKTDRFKSPFEEFTGAKPLRKCAICKRLTNHDKRNCPSKLNENA